MYLLAQKTEGTPRYAIPGIVAIVFLLVFLGMSFWGTDILLRDADIGTHIRVGDKILSERSIPRTAVFSELEGEASWTNHSWLAQVIMSVAHSAGGMSGVVVLYSFLIALAYALLVRWGMDQEIHLVMIIGILLMSLAVGAMYWSARPQQFSMLFVVIFHRIMFLYDRDESKHIYILPAIALLWANLHIGFAVGLLVIATYCLSFFVEFFVQKKGGDPAKRKFIVASCVFAACVVSSCANPYGWNLYSLVFNVTQNLEIQNTIVEFLSPNFKEMFYLPFLYMFLFSVTIFMFFPSKTSPVEVLMVLLFSYLAFTSNRFILFYGVIMVPILFRYTSLKSMLFEKKEKKHALFVEESVSPVTSSVGMSSVISFAAAKRSKSTGLKIESNEAYLHKEQGDEFLCAMDFERASEEYAKALSLHYKFSNVSRFLMAFSFYQAKRWDEAIREFNKILSEDPNNINARICLTDCFCEKEYYDLCLSESLKVLAVLPHHKDTLMTKARALRFSNHPEAAIAVYRDILSREYDFYARFYLIYTLLYKNRLSEAREEVALLKPNSAFQEGLLADTLGKIKKESRLAALKNILAKPYRNLSVACAGIVLLVLTLSLSGILRHDWNPARLPLDAARFIVEGNIPGRMFNPEQFAAVLTYMSPGQYKPFMDGRSDVYVGERWSDYLSVGRVQKNWQYLMDDKYQFDWVFYYNGMPLTDALGDMPDKWVRVYSDRMAEVYVRSTPSSQSFLSVHPAVEKFLPVKAKN